MAQPGSPFPEDNIRRISCIRQATVDSLTPSIGAASAWLSCWPTTSAAASGSFALARLTAQGGGATGAQVEQPSARTIQREVGKKWNAATRSFV